MSERDTQKAILDYLQASGIFGLRINTGTGWAKVSSGKLRPIRCHSGGAGVPDIIAFPSIVDKENNWRYTATLWIEVKSAKGKQSPEQKTFQEYAKRHGMFYILAKSVDDIQSWWEDYR